MKAIVAVDENWGIGKENGLLAHLPGDLKFFKEKTLGQTIFMGRNTLESLPGGKPLPDRTTIVLSSDKSYTRDDCIVIRSLGDMFVALEYDTNEELFCCGGAFVYHQCLQYFDTVYVTKMHQRFEADAFFPDLDANDDFEIVSESDVQEENGIRYTWVEYRRKGRAR